MSAAAPTHNLPRTPEWHGVDRAMFRERIMPANRPAVMRGLVADWPVVRAAASSPRAAADYVRRFDRGQPVETFIGAPAIKGRFWYGDDMRGYNFERRAEPYAAAVERVLALMDDPDPPAVYAGAVPTAQNFPGFARENALALVDDTVVSRIWTGNAATVSTHFDVSDNVACVVAGRRRFTFFPPDQLGNLYVGPLDFTLAGQPVSMVDLAAPDFDRYPRFAEALAQAQVAELGPGDAVFIPTLWWHNIVSLERFNLLVNYWWTDAVAGTGSPFEALVHGILSISDLPEHKRAAWRTLFDHYVFQSGGDPVPHLIPRHRGILGKMTPALAGYIKSFLQKALQRP